MLTPSSGHCLQNVAYVLRSMYGFCTKMSDLSDGNLFSPDILARVRRIWFDEDGRLRDAALAGEIGKDDCLRFIEAICREGAGAARDDEQRGETREVEVRGAEGNAGVQAAEAEDGVSRRGGVGEAVVVVDEGCIFGYLVCHDGLSL
ncbi:unnamed protein product [Clonostachys rosea]|uniref:Uncharacterized protein n=1 Tax=Bionectria ochroleuca TaxID=29856 RepID=A0ABY6U590_BIOOC|nr:unnamed protein product [Clonostachys rosea]